MSGAVLKRKWIYEGDIVVIASINTAAVGGLGRFVGEVGEVKFIVAGTILCLTISLYDPLYEEIRQRCFSTDEVDVLC